MPRCSILRLTLTMAVLLPTCCAAQSQDSQSVAEAARRAREAKQKATQKSKVVTDDDIRPGAAPAARATENAPAGQAPATGQASPAAEATGKAPADASSSPKAEQAAAVAKAKEALAAAEKELSLLRRELALEQDSFFSNPDHDRNGAVKAHLDAEQQEINSKQALVDELKARLAALLPAGPSAESPKTPEP